MYAATSFPCHVDFGSDNELDAYTADTLASLVRGGRCHVVAVVRLTYQCGLLRSEQRGNYTSLTTMFRVIWAIYVAAAVYMIDTVTVGSREAFLASVTPWRLDTFDPKRHKRRCSMCCWFHRLRLPVVVTWRQGGVRNPEIREKQVPLSYLDEVRRLDDAAAAGSAMETAWMMRLPPPFNSLGMRSLVAAAEHAIPPAPAREGGDGNTVASGEGDDGGAVPAAGEPYAVLAATDSTSLEAGVVNPLDTPSIALSSNSLVTTSSVPHVPGTPPTPVAAAATDNAGATPKLASGAAGEGVTTKPKAVITAGANDAGDGAGDGVRPEEVLWSGTAPSVSRLRLVSYTLAVGVLFAAAVVCVVAAVSFMADHRAAALAVMCAFCSGVVLMFAALLLTGSEPRSEFIQRRFPGGATCFVVTTRRSMILEWYPHFPSPRCRVVPIGDRIHHGSVRVREVTHTALAAEWWRARANTVVPASPTCYGVRPMCGICQRRAVHKCCLRSPPLQSYQPPLQTMDDVVGGQALSHRASDHVHVNLAEGEVLFTQLVLPGAMWDHARAPAIARRVRCLCGGYAQTWCCFQRLCTTVCGDRVCVRAATEEDVGRDNTRPLYARGKVVAFGFTGLSRRGAAEAGRILRAQVLEVEDPAAPAPVPLPLVVVRETPPADAEAAAASGNGGDAAASVGSQDSGGSTRAVNVNVSTSGLALL